MKISFRRFSPLCVLALSAVCGGAARAQTTVFSDEFNTSFNTNQWDVYDSTHSLQRTQFGNVPQTVLGSQSTDGTGYMRLRLDTYNPDRNYPTFVRGTEITSREFKPGPGLEIEARVRGANLPRGIVFAFFTLGQRGTWPTSYLKEEIDFEFLTNFLNTTDANPDKNKLWLNVWDDWNPLRGGPNQATRTLPPASANFQPGGWNVYKIRWLNDKVEWIVNGVVVRTSTNILPDDPMQLRFNIWAAGDWGTAADFTANGVVATSDPRANKAYYMDVDYVRVKTVAPPAGSYLGNGDGLAATYYDNKDFTNTKITRVEPRVKFDWGQNSPDPSIGVDTFSARWNGWVQPQFTQNYTFSATADDGVRVWVNNALVIDGWKDQAPTRYPSAPIALTAGKLYPIRVEYYENGGGASVRLAWNKSGSTLPEQLIPQSQLYSVNDTTPPTIAFTTPRANYSYRTLASASGTATDSGSGVKSVGVRLLRASDSYYWNGSAWVSTVTELTATGTTSWSLALPPMTDGRYSLQARARDYVGLYSPLTSVSFYIDNVAPAIVVTTPQATDYSSLSSASGTASDAVGVASVSGRLYRYSDKTFWNGSSWTASRFDLKASGTKSWSLALPALAPGNYYYQALARDFYGNLNTAAAINFSVTSAVAARTTQPSGSALSTISASAGQNAVVLGFITALDPATANDPANYSVESGGEVRPISGVLFGSAQNSVTLKLAAGTLRSGDKILVNWNGGRDANGKVWPAEAWTVVVQ